ncbi:MFS transporter [Occultella aeris]|uniref:Major Facilitator Superfamily protein n=1 Tax=Occultella aeris TaxID=2761496 RepID=A0A7M4DSK2_9MICO|nr:MFS transporter [Occultella aeris]VZO40446.1 Major Facilitator Superfamily protein [Occultella aeris]
MARIDGRSIGVLIVSNLLGGVGVASGVAVGGLLAERLGGTSVAGLAQAASVLGAAVAAVPLAAMATRRGRRWALSLGYAFAVVGALLIIASAVLSQLIIMLVGLGLFGVAQAVNLQSRYAAADNAPLASRARTMSIVIWATTVGSVAGPNLTAVGDRLGLSLGLPGLVGAYLFSVVSFASAATVLALFFRPVAAPAAPGQTAAPAAPGPTAAVGSAVTARPVGAIAALRWAGRHPVARFAVVLTACAHSVMVMVMVMTPLHMQHHGMSLELVGIVISLHVLGMYALSPVFGWLADRWGAVHTAIGGMVILVVAVALGFLAAALAAGGSEHAEHGGDGGGSTLTAVALTILGIGWSACIISASSLLAGVSSDEVRIPLQGATDAGMNYAGALAAALAGPILAFGDFRGVNVAAVIILVPAFALVLPALRRHVAGDAPDPGADEAPPSGSASAPLADSARPRP